MAFAVKTIMADERKEPRLEVFNFIVVLKHAMKSRQSQLVGESAPTYINNLIGEFLNTYFPQSAYFFEPNRYDQYVSQLNLTISKVPKVLPPKRLDEEKLSSEIIKIDKEVCEKYEY